ncbi:very short patch repair endonuclease [Pseudoduganella chitinolytica]|uniref:Very short patch repair endonuclease n=1 Tax=Pseudoduganella chitinolytica TaxID=34070 RepID=A0ABY8B4J1_9BURK|nr:very short patch repair endonuclease [Pseudoduganella chitinolytica]WEF30700.1 very short patch repair endonuclease [Pseudoduganella chitinolytica]
MADSVSVQRRSEIMARVKGKHTSPELSVRRMLHAAGYRYRLHVGKLPGKPDLVFPGRSKVILINGCFWHRHRGCSLARLPKSRVEFWTEKLERNRQRDARNVEALQALGWGVLTVWECELQDPSELLVRLKQFLDEPSVGSPTSIGFPIHQKRA